MRRVERGEADEIFSKGFSCLCKLNLPSHGGSLFIIFKQANRECGKKLSQNKHLWE